MDVKKVLERVSSGVMEADAEERAKQKVHRILVMRTNGCLTQVQQITEQHMKDCWRVATTQQKQKHLRGILRILIIRHIQKSRKRSQCLH